MSGPGSTWISDCIRGRPSGISVGSAEPSPDFFDDHHEIVEEPGPGPTRPTEVGLTPSSNVPTLLIQPCSQRYAITFFTPGVTSCTIPLVLAVIEPAVVSGLRGRS